MYHVLCITSLHYVHYIVVTVTGISITVAVVTVTSALSCHSYSLSSPLTASLLLVACRGGTRGVMYYILSTTYYVLHRGTMCVHCIATSVTGIAITVTVAVVTVTFHHCRRPWFSLLSVASIALGTGHSPLRNSRPPASLLLVTSGAAPKGTCTRQSHYLHHSSLVTIVTVAVVTCSIVLLISSLSP
jgi:hypothetical protein